MTLGRYQDPRGIEDEVVRGPCFEPPRNSRREYVVLPPSFGMDRALAVKTAREIRDVGGATRATVGAALRGCASIGREMYLVELGGKQPRIYYIKP